MVLNFLPYHLFTLINRQALAAEDGLPLAALQSHLAPIGKALSAFEEHRGGPNGGRFARGHAGAGGRKKPRIAPASADVRGGTLCGYFGHLDLQVRKMNALFCADHYCLCFLCLSCSACVE